MSNGSGGLPQWFTKQPEWFWQTTTVVYGSYGGEGGGANAIAVLVGELNNLNVLLFSFGEKTLNGPFNRR